MTTYHHGDFTYIITPRKNGRMVTIQHGAASTPVFMDVDSDEKALEALGVPKGYVTLVARNNKPMKIVGESVIGIGSTPKKGKRKYERQHQVRVIVVEERDAR